MTELRDSLKTVIKELRRCERQNRIDSSLFYWGGEGAMAVANEQRRMIIVLRNILKVNG